MNVHVSYKVNKTPDIEKEINHHVEKLQKRLQVFRPELVHLKGVIEHNSVREGFIVSLNLRLPSGQMAVQQSAPVATAALKSAFDDLIQQLTKHKDHLRSHHKFPRWRGREERSRREPEVPFEQTVAAVQPPMVSPEDIRSYIDVNLDNLKSFVERELRYRESAGQLRPDSLKVEEVIDEAIADALGEGIEKPERLALEPWLYRLAIRAIDRLSRRTRDGSEDVPLEHSLRSQNILASDEPLLEFHQPDEQLLAEDVIPDPRIATPEDVAASDEMITLVESALLSAAPPDREAFILYAIEGFTVDEIAAITDRKPEEVRASILAAREHLKKSLPIPNEFKDLLLQHSKIA